MRRVRQQGFTLIEMMVALGMGAIIVATVFTVGVSSARHFQEQQRISQLQLSVRLALDRVRRDAQRGSFLGVRNSALGPNCGGRPPAPGIRGVAVVDRWPETNTALGAMPGWNAGVSHGDLLTLTGNFRTGDNYLIREWNGTSMTLQTGWHGYQRSFTADPSSTTVNIDTDLAQRTFAAGTTLMVQAGGGQRIWTSATGATIAASGNSATINTSPGFPTACSGEPGIEGWCQNGCTVAPITTVVYQIATAPAVAGITRTLNLEATGANTVLTRTEVNALTGQVLNGPTRILDYAVHFDVDVVADTAVAPAPMLLQVADDAAATQVSQLQPQQIRALRISLAARTPEQDEHLTAGIANLADGTPRVFPVFVRPGAARVRSAYTEVFLPN
jgi:prepilin-type N-terminal cleavage/methylation domain-containing protein